MAKAPEAVRRLVAQFQQNIESYRAQAYNEAQTRAQFIGPFFEALGWDVHNKAGFAEAYKDVILEDSIKVGGATKAPDYCFCVGGARKFFLEAKKPSVSIETDISPPYQLRRYAWSAKLPLAVLTDFEELAVYHCRTRPRPNDKVGVDRVLLLKFTDYESRWEEIASIFSKEAVMRGSFDKYVADMRPKRGTSEVDREFLSEIERWRDLLARNIALRNPKLSVRELNFAVQSSVARILFLRICEDRGVEQYGQLQALLNGVNTYARLQALYRMADDKYNSGIFHFQREKNRPTPPDELTPHLKIDDAALKEIIRALYYPDSPYEFSVLPADILGNVYEQFLGKVIRLTAGHQAKVEEKPEVKKAGGVYYTPRYIVDYIVKNTVGKLCEGKTPKEISALRILDPACGSGSFLIGAYQYFLDYHRDWYLKNAECGIGNAESRMRNTPKSAIQNPTCPPGRKSQMAPVYQGRGGNWFLTTAEKKRILLNNIYGVDIDAQAVEVTKLNLLLKVLEGETSESVASQQRMFHERALPDLDSNIKCGNSLIGPDYYKNVQQTMFDEEERMRINAFDWHTEFPEVFHRVATEDTEDTEKVDSLRARRGRQTHGAKNGGGFDVVIGNPPYVRIQMMKEWAPVEVELYKKKYVSASKGNYDIYVVFIEKGLSLLNQQGRLGFIVPHKFFNSQYGEPVRELIAGGRHLAHVVHFGDQQVFDGATTYTCLLVLSRSATKECRFIKVSDLDSWRRDVTGAVEGVVSSDQIGPREWNLTVGKAGDLTARLAALPLKLDDVTDRIFQGIKTSADAIYIVEELRRKGSRVEVYSRQTGGNHWLEGDLLHPLVKGGDSKRYALTQTIRRILFPYAPVGKGKAELIRQEIMVSTYPLTWAYLNTNKGYLEDREHGRMRGSKWYGYIYPKALDVMHLPKIFTPDIAARASFSLDETGNCFFTGGVAGGYGLLVSAQYSREYILGLLNSRLLEWVIKQTATQMRGGYYSFESRFIRSLPIRPIDLSDSTEKARHDKMVSLVTHILELNKRLSSANTPQEKIQLQREIEATDKEVDTLVYELYILTEEEIRVVERNS